MPNTLTNPVAWFEIHVDDLDRAQRFYEAVFERTLEPLVSPLPGVRMLAFQNQPGHPGAMGALIEHPMKQPSTEGVLVYFSCSDCAIQMQRALDVGGKVHKPKTSLGPNGFIAIIGDSEGNAIGLHSLH